MTTAPSSKSQNPHYYQGAEVFHELVLSLNGKVLAMSVGTMRPMAQRSWQTFER
jgi:hypothetical protein